MGMTTRTTKMKKTQVRFALFDSFVQYYEKWFAVTNLSGEYHSIRIKGNNLGD